MTLATFATPSNTLPPTAALQQMICMVYVAYYRQGLLQNYLQQHGSYELLHFTPFFGRWVPGWAFFRSGGNYYLVISGTAALQHVAVDLFAVAGSDRNHPDSLFHPGFLAAAETIMATLQPLLPDPDLTGGKVCVCGFSLGGAVGTLLALALLPTFTEARVELLTFGAPRVLTTRYAAGTFPSVHQRVVHAGDAIPDLPPRGLQPLFNALSPLQSARGGQLPFFGEQINYRHYGRCFRFNLEGQLLSFTDEDSANSGWDFTEYAALHSAAAYYRTIRRWVQAQS